MTTKILIRLIAVSLAVLFFYAAVGKLDDYTIFYLQLQKFPVSIPVIQQHPWLVPVTELGMAGLLLIPSFRVKGLFSSLFLLSVYTIYLTCMLDNKYNLPCDCGEVLQSLSLRSHIIFNFVCVFITGVAIVLCGKGMQTPVSNKKFPFIRPYYKPADKAVERMN
jgi:methylamine utilization protein MauE